MAGSQEFGLTDKHFLVRVVKDCQKAKLQGAQGSWKDYLKSQTLTKTDPTLHSWQILAGFLATLSRPQAGVVLGRHKDWEQHQQQRAALVSRLSQTNATESCQDPIWLMVEKSLTHPRFSEGYNLSSFEQGWMRTSSAGLDISSRPCLLSLDCEMCQTATNVRELIGLSVVNEAGSTVLKMLVKPAGKVLDFRTDVTGATEATMQGVTYNKQDAQDAVQKLMQGNVVLVGHALHHDLHALQLDPIAVIDTSLLCSYKDLATCTPSLANLVSQMLNRSLRQEGAPHDCEQDAAAAMQLVNHAIQHGLPPPMEAPQIKVSKSDLKKLFVHSIPSAAQPADLLHLFEACTCACPTVEGNMKDRRGHLVFKHAGDANEAFKQLPGAQDTDSFGRAQKQLKLTAGSCKGKIVKIRKMAAHGGLAFGKDSSQKMHAMQQEAQRKLKLQDKQRKRKKAKI
ncbi:hypothetical protein ABBQ38_000903 [Trebouxia sp. C0009 RCD-2024]